MLREPFHYLAAREVLDGVKGWVLNHLGAYSVIRGVPDRESLRMTRRLLGEMNRKVVIFPEGEIYEYNDTLLAFQSGVAQIGFWTLDDLAKAGAEPELPLVPVAIKYRCSDWPRSAIDASLRDLERALALPATRGLSSYARLLQVGRRVLSALERQEGIRPDESAALNERIAAARRKLLERVARAIGSEVDSRQSPADQLHLLFHALKSWVGVLPGEHSDYDERLYARRMAVAEPLFRDLHRLQNFIAVTGDYVAAEATAERFLDVLSRLEREVFGQVRHPVPRDAVVRIGEPIRLEARVDAYRANKRQTVSDVTAELERSIRDMLRDLSREATPLEITA
jgi:1-acyl-sn-glycerol-3-phosphate acyltransferase